ncbi:MAG: MATE family efflux transporter [Kiritimatiellae bacterium]|nr:MATE family efflux transporter [Kiritimatiellia bacterium]
MNPDGKRSEIQALLAIVWPLIVTNLLNVTVGIADMKMVGMLGVAPIAAVGMSRQIFMLILSLMIAITGGTSVLVAHAYGARNPRRVSEVAARSVVFMLATAVLVVMPLGLIFARDILGMLGAADTVAQLGERYLQVVFAGCIFTMFNFATTGILLGVGKTWVSMTILGVINALNVALNYVFIFGVGPIPALGVTGAAVGTVASRGIGSVACFWALSTRRLPVRMRLRDGLTLDWRLLGQILGIGGPRTLEGLVRNVSRLAVIRIVALFDTPTRAIAAYNVGMQVRYISTFVGLAFMHAAMSRVGQNLGAGEPDRAEQSGHQGAKLAAIIMGVAALFFLVFPEPIMGFFTDDPDVIAMGRAFFLIVALTEPVMGAAFSYGGALRGGGDAVSPLLYAGASDLFVMLGASYLLGVRLNMGMQGVAIGIAVSVVTRAVPSWLRFRQGKWKATRF